MSLEENRPDYYLGPDHPYEPIKVILAWELKFALGNVVKYAFRAGRKPGATALDDMRKMYTYAGIALREFEKNISAEQAVKAWKRATPSMDRSIEAEAGEDA